MNPFVLPINELTNTWKELRRTIEDGGDIQEVVDFWSQAPLSKMSYDYEALDTWPTAWEMMANNDWCENSIAIGMEFTLRLAGVDADRLVLKFIRDYDISEQKMVLEIDGKHWLNYKYRTITDIPSTNYDVLSVWHFDGRKYTQC